MNITILSKHVFEKFFKEKDMDHEKAKYVKDMFFISIIDQGVTPTFKDNGDNFKVMIFPDGDSPEKFYSLESGDFETTVPFTDQQADELVAFIKKNIDKNHCIIHCTLGVSRSAAVGSFINDVLRQDWFDFKRKNSQIQPNAFVYNKLKEAWTRADYATPVFQPFWIDDEAMFFVTGKGDNVEVYKKTGLATEEILKEMKQTREIQVPPVFGRGPGFTGEPLYAWLLNRDMLKFIL